MTSVRLSCAAERKAAGGAAEDRGGRGLTACVGLGQQAECWTRWGLFGLSLAGNWLWALSKSPNLSESQFIHPLSLNIDSNR